MGASPPRLPLEISLAPPSFRTGVELAPAPPGDTRAALNALARALVQRAYPRTSRAVAAYAASAAVIVLAFIAFFDRTQSGQLRIAIASDRGGVEKAEVFVDGQKRCDVAPCLIGDLAPGPKSVRVIAAGFLPAPAITITVEPGIERFAVVPLGEPVRRASSESAPVEVSQK